MRLVSQSISGTMKIYRHRLRYRYDLQLCLTRSKRDIRATLLRQRDRVKFQITVHVRFIKLEYNELGEATNRISEPYFLSKIRVFDPDSFSDDTDDMISEIIAHFDNYVESGSGWRLQRILELDLKVYKVDHF